MSGIAGPPRGGANRRARGPREVAGVDVVPLTAGVQQSEVALCQSQQIAQDTRLDGRFPGVSRLHADACLLAVERSRQWRQWFTPDKCDQLLPAAPSLKRRAG